MMKKRIIIFSAIFATLCSSCAIDPLAYEDGRGGTTTITFTPDFGDIAGGQGTKAFDVNPQVQNLYLAVFNEGGEALVEYVKAESVQPAEQNEPMKYSYKATLKVTNKKRVVHLIANAPEEIGYGSAEDAVGGLLYNFDTDNWTGQDAYWGYLELPNGICEQSDAAGCNALIAKFSEVKLVRNFAQIKVSAAEGSNFTVTRFWISNFPDRASAAPYNRSERRFETTYSSYEYATSAMNNGYEGFCPASAGLVSLKGMNDTRLNAIQCAPGGTAFTYEREMPVSDPLCIIVEGTSTLSGGNTKTFYKIDLRDNSGKYIPVLRNFIYEVSIGNVLKLGEPNVEAALNSVSSGAIDTDLSLKDLKDLSNGKSRIAVSETERVLFNSEPFYLFYLFIPDISTGEVVNKTLADWVAEGAYDSEQAVLDAHAPYVTVDRESHGESGNVIDRFTIATTDEPDGYRAVTMVPVPVGGATRTEVFTVTGHVWNSVKNSYETLQRRTVNYQMRERPRMVLKLSREGVRNILGDTLKLKIGIEENLPKSLFTVDMKITTEQMSLTPNSNDLTISSEVGVDGKPTFYITKAITWEEYNRTTAVLDSDGKYRKYFTCPLKTNTKTFRDVDISYGPGDRIIVTNDDFETATTLFMAGNVNLKRFINLHLDKDYFVAGRPATISFGMTKLPSDGKVFVGLKSLKPYDESLEPADTDQEGYTLYEISVSSIDSESLELIPTASSGMSYVKLVKEGEFNPVYPLEKEIRTPGFDDLKFKYQNLGYVVSGKEALACFHMDYLPLGDAKVTIHLKNAVPVDGTAAGETDAYGYTPYQISVTDNDVEFPVKISPTPASETKAYFKLSADNYTTSNPAEAAIQKLQFSDLELINVNNPAKSYVVGGKPARIMFSLDDMPGEGNVIKLTLNNLTIPDGAVMTHGTYVKDSDTEYTLSITNKDDVTIEVIPATGVTAASYTLSDTMSEFDSKTCTATVKKLSFSNVKLINVNDPVKNYVIGGKPVKISFTMEDMPADGTITLDLTDSNLTLGSGMTGASGITDNEDGTYTVTVTGTSVTIDATPAVNVSKAKFKLTDDEFYDGECETTVQKLSFSGLNFNINTGTEYLLAGDNTSTVTFKVDQLPADGDVTLWIMNAAVNGHTAAGAAADGYTPYTVAVDGSKTTTLGITVNQTGFNGLNNTVKFYLTDDEFTKSSTGSRLVKTRCIINWANILVQTDDTTYPKAVSKSVSVFRNAACTDSATDFGPLTTDADGYVSSPVQTVIDSDLGGAETYYFNFTNGSGDNPDTYKSGGVTLAALAAGDDIACAIQPKNYTIAANTLRITDGRNPLGKATVFVRLNSSTNETGQKSFTTTNGNPAGYNQSSVTINCTKNTDIYFVSGTKESRAYKISELTDGEVITVN